MGRLEPAKPNFIPPKRYLWVAVVLLFGVPVVGLLVIDFVQVRRLRQDALGIKVGDTRAQVFKLLGEPKCHLCPAAPAGSYLGTDCYGGLRNELWLRVADLVSDMPDGWRIRLFRLVALDYDDWRVRFDYDLSEKVTAVYR
jgi:hypothetical protein